MRGFVTSITNPKALAFFGSAFALTAPAQPTLQYHLAAVVGLTVLSATWHSLLALIFETPVLQRGYRAMKGPIDLLVGSVLVVFGGGMLAQGRRMFSG
jgi:threonine/homoserine/homoserine lactone efflux protein